MSGFRVHTGISATLPRDNIDTDQIIPSREMKRVSKKGLSDGLFAGQRYVAPGSREPNPDFILNQKPFDRASIIVSGKNFGCGSSREHAVWALAEFGIKAIIAESFGEIFFNNCVRNGIVPVQLSHMDAAMLYDETQITVNLETLTIKGDYEQFGFTLADSDRQMLLKGLDPITLTLEDRPAIEAFLEQDKTNRPWVY